MFEQSFKNIDDILHKDAGCGSELDYVEQTSWILFLKYLDDLEKDRKTAAMLSGKEYKAIIDERFRWENWAVPKNETGKIDHNIALSGDDLRDFVDHELFPYLKKFKYSAESPDTIEYKIGEIFSKAQEVVNWYQRADFDRNWTLSEREITIFVNTFYQSSIVYLWNSFRSSTWDKVFMSKDFVTLGD